MLFLSLLFLVVLTSSFTEEVTSLLYISSSFPSSLGSGGGFMDGMGGTGLDTEPMVVNLYHYLL